MRYLTSIRALTLALILTAGLAGCDSTGTEPDPEPPPAPQNLVEVNSIHNHDTGEHLFELSTSEIPSGWATFRLNNQSHADHFILLSKVPDGIGLDDWRTEVVRVIQNFLDSILENEISFPEAGFEFPDWYAEIQFMGGPGLTAPERTSQATMNLSPGTYILECYIKSADGTQWHHTLGMLAELTVTEEVSPAEAPEPTLAMTLRNPANGGIDVEEGISSGEHTLAVDFAEQQVYSTGATNDVHLARLNDDTDLDALGAWMNALDPAGFISPGAPAEFLGGIEDMPVGTTGYFTVELTPGRYAWIAEVPDPAEKGMLKTFTVE